MRTDLFMQLCVSCVLVFATSVVWAAEKGGGADGGNDAVDAELRTAPKDFRASARDHAVLLRWKQLSGVRKYRICMAQEQITSPINCTAFQGGRWLFVTKNKRRVNKLENGQTYFFTVARFGAKADRAFSPVISATPVKPPPVATGKLNDTGITKCGDASSNDLVCTDPAAYAGQDGHYGRDVTHNDDSDGHAGFSFTKIDASGREVSASANEWHCVQDNVTGLMWEVKQGAPDSIVGNTGLHDPDDSYNWYEPDKSKNGGYAGFKDDDGAICYGYNSTKSSTYCNTHAYVNRVNANGWCGYSDWRLPTVEELRSIVNYGDALMIDTDYFPNTESSSFWSSSSYANDGYIAWSVGFDYGYDYTYGKYDARYVRIVRGGQ